MLWWVSQARLNAVLKREAKAWELVDELKKALDDVEGRWRHNEGQLLKALDIANALRRDEQWRRIKAEGRLAYTYDRLVQLRACLWPNGT